MKTMLAASAVFFWMSGAVLADASTTLSMPVGDILNGLWSYLALGLAGLITWALRFLPAQAQALALTARADQLLQRAVEFGINAVANATAGKVLDVNVGNAVLCEALQFALAHGADAVKQFAGSPVDLAEKIWARLDLAPEVSKPDFAAIAAAVAARLAKART